MGSIITLLHCGHKETATQQHSMQTYRNRKLDCCRCCGLLIIAGGLTEVAHIVRSVTVDSVHSWQVGGKGKGERVFPSMRTCSWWLLFKKRPCKRYDGACVVAFSGRLNSPERRFCSEKGCSDRSWRTKKPTEWVNFEPMLTFISGPA